MFLSHGGPAPNTLLAPRSTLGDLERAAASGENPPPAQVETGFQRASATLDATLRHWEAVRASDMAMANARLKKANMPELPSGGR